MFTKKDAAKFLYCIDKNINNYKFTLSDLKHGLNVELEHGLRDPETNVTNNSLIMTGKIALAHLKEDSKYYDKLKAIEGGKSHIQSILFNKYKYSIDSAKVWLKSHHYKPLKDVHITDKYLRFRIFNPNKNAIYYTIKLSNGIKLVVMK